MSIKNIDFRNDPDRLVAVVITPENVGMITELAQKHDVDASKLMTFESFLNKCRLQYRKNQQVTNTSDNSQEI